MNTVFFLSSLASLICNFMVGIFVLLENRQGKLNKLFFLFLTALSIWIFGDIFHFFPLFESVELKTGLQLAHLGAIFTPPFFVHFTQTLASKKFNSKTVWLFYVTAIALSICNLFNILFIESAVVNQDFSVIMHTGAIYNVLLLTILAALFYGYGKIILSIRQSNGIVRQRLIVFLFASVVLLFATVVYFPAIFGYSVWRIDNLFLTLFFVIIAYGITKHEFLDIRLVITRTAAIAFTALCICLSVLALLLFTPDSIQYKFTTSVTLIAFWILYANKLRLFIQTPLQKKWVKGWYDETEILNHLSKQLIPLSERVELTRTLCDVIENEMNLSGATFIDCDTHFLRGMWEDQMSVIKKENLPTDYQANIDEIVSYRWGAVLSIWDTSDFQGVLVIGIKLSEDPFSEKDYRFLDLIRSQTTVFFDRLKPYEQIKSELVTAQEEAQKARAYAEKVSQQASFAMLTKGIAHEIRNPLAMMLGTIDVFIYNIDQVSRNPEILDQAKGLRKSTKRLEAILDTMLTFGNPENIEMKHFDLTRVANSTIELMQGKMNEVGITFSSSVPEEVQLYGHSVLVSQSIFNIMMNAIQAIEEIENKSEKVLSLTIVQNDAMTMIEVADSGKGISEDQKAHIFDAFNTTKYENTGLGLSLVLQIMEKHGGKIEFESVEGKGSTFRLVFPR